MMMIMIDDDDDDDDDGKDVQGARIHFHNKEMSCLCLYRGTICL